MQQQLDRKKEQFRQRMQRCQEKEVDLAAKQEAIKEQVRKFDKFLKENDAKRVRANRKALEEVRTREAKELERQALVAEFGRQQGDKDLLLEELERLHLFERFLERTCERHADHFEDIEVLLIYIHRERESVSIYIYVSIFISLALALSRSRSLSLSWNFKFPVIYTHYSTGDVCLGRFRYLFMYVYLFYSNMYIGLTQPGTDIERT